MKILRNQRGSTLVLTLLIVTIFSIVAITAFKAHGSSVKQVETRESEIQARNLAEMGIQDADQSINETIDNIEAENEEEARNELKEIFEEQYGDREVKIKEGKSYELHFEREAHPDEKFETWMVTSFGAVNGSKSQKITMEKEIPYETGTLIVDPEQKNCNGLLGEVIDLINDALLGVGDLLRLEDLLGHNILEPISTGLVGNNGVICRVNDVALDPILSSILGPLDDILGSGLEAVLDPVENILQVLGLVDDPEVYEDGLTIEENEEGENEIFGNNVHVIGDLIINGHAKFNGNLFVEGDIIAGPNGSAEFNGKTVITGEVDTQFQLGTGNEPKIIYE